VFTRERERVPSFGLAADGTDLNPEVFPPIYTETSEGAAELTNLITDITGSTTARVAFDDMSAALLSTITGSNYDFEIVDAGLVTVPAKLVKTADEVTCLRAAQEINELALTTAYEALKPGVKQSELTGLFLEEIYSRGAEHNNMDPIFDVMARSREHGPFSVNGGVVFPTPTTDLELSRGDLLFVDASISIGGYHSDVGRTWIVGCDEVDSNQRAWFDRWLATFQAVLDVTRPGATGADLTRAAHAIEPDCKPWLDEFYLCHGVGTESSEMPWIGTDRGPGFDAQMVLEPGMVFMLEPVIWQEGVGGYRSEEMVLVTEGGYEVLHADLPYAPFTLDRMAWQT
jgi:Xaa-Pro aminopeptidase